MNQPTNQQIANSYALWIAYIDTDATMTEAEFNVMTPEDRLHMIEQAFAADE